MCTVHTRCHKFQELCQYDIMEAVAELGASWEFWRQVQLIVKAGLGTLADLERTLQSFPINYGCLFLDAFNIQSDVQCSKLFVLTRFHGVRPD